MDNMHIQSITLKNYRMFRDFTCDFDPGMTVLVADNGGGKTTVLDAIRVALGPYFSVFPTGSGVGMAVHDVYTFIQNGNLGQRRTEFPANIAVLADLDGVHKNVAWSRALNGSKSGTTLREAKPVTEFANALFRADVPDCAPTNWPVLAYYGTGRLWNLKKLTAGKQFADGFYGRSAGYTDCMDPASSYKLVLSWLRYAAKVNFEAKMRFADANPAASVAQLQAFRGPFSPLLDALRHATNIVLAPSGWKNVSYSETLEDAVVEHDELGTMPVSQLSDGIRNTVALVADLAYRAVQLNPHLAERAAQESCGVVLIDEVDMHLHPSWQQTILSSLRAAFPKIQFIVTTHSPQVLSTVRRENIRLITRGDTGFVASMPTMSPLARAAGDVLAHVMNVDVRPPLDEILDTVRAYEHLVRQKKIESPEALAVKARLEAVGYEIPAADLALWTFLGAQAKEGRHG